MEVTLKGRSAHLLFYVVAQDTSILRMDAIRVLDLHIQGSYLCEDATLEQVKVYVSSSWPPQKSVSGELQPFFAAHKELSVVDDLLLR